MLTLRYILCYSAEHSINHVVIYISIVVIYVGNVVIYINLDVIYRLCCRVAKFSSQSRKLYSGESQTLFRSVGGGNSGIEADDLCLHPFYLLCLMGGEKDGLSALLL